MAYTTEQMARNLKTAREAKGFSQRVLAKLAGVPQSHISKIENGTVDLRLSSLAEVARALGLEVVLVPRKTLPAVQSIVRSALPLTTTSATRDIQKEFQKLQKNLSAALNVNPVAKEIAQMQQAVKEIQRLQVSPPQIDFLRDVNETVRQFNNQTKGIEDFRRILDSVQQFRNSLAHAIPRLEHVKPAYTLEENGDG